MIRMLKFLWGRMMSTTYFEIHGLIDEQRDGWRKKQTYIVMQVQLNVYKGI